MFDDKPIKGSGNVPSNLPTEEPDDMFSGTDKAENNISSQPASALDAGILRPRVNSNSNNNVQPGNTSVGDYKSAGAGMGVMNSQPMSQNSNGNFENPKISANPAMREQTNAIEEPVGKSKLVTFIVIVVVIALLAVAGAWGYYKFIKKGSNYTVPAPEQNTVADIETPTNIDAPVENISDSQANVNLPSSVQPSIPTTDEQILFGEPVDTDGDSLTDTQENEIGTSPMNWDTDADELSDGDEVNNWKTDPLDKDTDNDSYLDGSEVKNGYNPNGLGKIADILNAGNTASATAPVGAPTP